jgi:hypothetical protein
MKERKKERRCEGRKYPGEGRNILRPYREG